MIHDSNGGSLIFSHELLDNSSAYASKTNSMAICIISIVTHLNIRSRKLYHAKILKIT